MMLSIHKYTYNAVDMNEYSLTSASSLNNMKSVIRCSLEDTTGTIMSA